MDERVKLTKLILGVVAVLIVIGGFWLYTEKNQRTTEIDNLKQALVKQKKLTAKKATAAEKVTKQYDVLYQEKSGNSNEDLVSAAKGLFSTIYEYKSDTKEGLVQTRKDAASKYAEAKALETLFPKGSEKSTSSVTSVSQLEKDPEVYLMATASKEQSALVMIHYSVSIAGSEKQKGTFMYKVIFDVPSKKFIAIQNIGDVDVP